MFTKFLRWFWLVAIASMLAACGGGNEEETHNAPSKAKARSTMMVYLVASDLLDGRGAERDLLNMMSAKQSPDVNVVLQIGGGATIGSFPGLNLQHTKRYHLVYKPDSFGWSLEPLPPSQQPSTTAPMNHEDTLRDFIQVAAQNYPAEQYNLALWNHGGGPIGGFGLDHAPSGLEDESGNAITLSTANIVSAIRQAGVHFELIGFDACLMSSLEVAKALQPYANYLIGSEEITTGWDWKAVIDFLVQHPSTKGDAFGRAILDSYKTFKDTDQDLDFTAYAVTNLQNIPNLVQSLEEAADALNALLETNGLQTWLDIAKARDEAEDFQSNIFNTSSDLVDVLSFVQELKARQLLNEALANKITQAFHLAVVHQDGGEDRAHGLMMYFPQYSVSDEELLQKYAALDFSPKIQNWVARYAKLADSNQMPHIRVGSPRLAGSSMLADVTSSVGGLSHHFSQAYAVLLKDGVAQSMQSVASSGLQVQMQNSNLWPHVDGQLISWLPDDDEQTWFVIPAANEGKELGMLYAQRTPDGNAAIKYYVAGDENAGFGLAMLEIEPGDIFYPLQLDTTTMRFKPGTQLDAPDGEWVVEMRPITGPGWTVHAAVADFTGQLKASATGVSLP